MKPIISHLLMVVVLTYCCSSNAHQHPNANKATLTTEAIQITDLAGRSLTFLTTPQRIILGDSRYLSALSILDRKKPLQRVVGTVTSLKQLDFGSYQQYLKKFPEIATIPQVGHASADSFSIENVISLNADLAIFGIEGHGPNARNRQVIEQLEKAGVQVVFVDFRHNPIINTVKSIQLLGKLLGRQQQAQEYAQFYQQQLEIVNTRLANVKHKEAQPMVFLHSRVGLQDLCCETMVKGMMATFLEQAQGTNVAKERIPGSAGVLNLEYLLTQQPDFYIATAIGSSREINSTQQPDAPQYIVLGAGITEQVAQQSFHRYLDGNSINELQAIQSGQAYAIWHHFYNSPLNIVAIQVFAKWLHPEAFSDVSPRLTLQVMFDRFQSVALEGTYWIGLSQ